MSFHAGYYIAGVGESQNASDGARQRTVSQVMAGGLGLDAVRMSLGLAKLRKERRNRAQRRVEGQKDQRSESINEES
jgi:hypothetical protein